MSDIIEKIHTLLSQSEHTETLFFISTKSSKKEDKVNFIPKKANINVSIGDDLRKYALSQLGLFKEKNLPIYEYGTVLSSDQTFLETISCTQVPHLSKLIKDMDSPNRDDYSQRELLENMFGYIVRIEITDNSVYLFKKYSRNKVLEKGLLRLLFEDASYKKLDPDVITLSDSYDAMLLVEKKDGKKSGEMLVISRSYFESFFQYDVVYQNNIQNNRQKLSDLNILNDCNELTTICSNNRNALRKLSRIIVSEDFNALTKDSICNTIKQYNLDIDIDQTSKKILVTDKNYWTVLRLLDDDYVKSDQTGFQYESHSKQKR